MVYPRCNRILSLNLRTYLERNHEQICMIPSSLEFSCQNSKVQTPVTVDIEQLLVPRNLRRRVAPVTRYAQIHWSPFQPGLLLIGNPS